MSVGKASIRRAASAGTRKSTGAKAADSVAETVLTPMNADEIQVKFLSGKEPEREEDKCRPVQINDRMPDYLL